MKAEIILTGTELLLGEIVDTNSMVIARLLRDIGLDLHYKTTVGDNEARIAEVLRHALSRVDVVIVSGGLGPTVDDVTRQAAAAAADRKLIYSPALEQQIAARFAKFGRKMGENNKRQAWIPEDALPVENPVGTAPCFIVETEQGSIICLPGVPRELEHQMKQAIIPWLKEKMGPPQRIKAKILRTCGIGESNIDRKIDNLMRLNNPTVGLAAHLGQVDVRITAKAPTLAEADALIAPVETEVRQRLGDVIFGVDDDELADMVGRLLKERGLQLAVVDTLTGDELAHEWRKTGHADVVQSHQQFGSAADALAASALDPGLEASVAASVIAQSLSRAGALGLCLIGPVATETAEQASLIALAHNGNVSVSQHLYGYRADEAGQQWLAAQTLNQLWRALKN